ncbi:hypothetical protein RUM44_011334 [Polyplax serrata]|uniref:PDZ domain-containing protein n=1 Tax=Polyplax serrata TaxID=468196 RepID=A0ABR1APR3_POLSC
MSFFFVRRHLRFVPDCPVTCRRCGKVKKKYESLGDSVLIVNLEKSHRGLGISLAGHKDRNRMAVFVCGINPNGAAFKTGGIEVGDEILELNQCGAVVWSCVEDLQEQGKLKKNRY